MAPGSAPTARPIARNVRPTATMWAWYQVVETWAVYQKTVPKAKKTVVPRRTTVPTGSRPIAHQQIATSMAARTVKMRLGVGREAPQRHERQQQDRRKRWERQQPPGDPIVDGDGQDVLEVGVAGRPAGRRDRIADRGVTFEEGGGLPDEVVVVAGLVGQPIDRQRHERERDPDAGRQPAIEGRSGGSVGPGNLVGVRRPTLCYAPIHLPRSCRSRSR